MIERTIYKQILFSIKNRPVTLITGARQVGKSTLCEQIEKELNFNYVSLDKVRIREEAKKDPELFLKNHPFPLIIDEIQKVPELFEYIEEIVNEEKRKSQKNYGIYVLTGSEVYKLMKGVSESLAGRVGIINMSPLSLSEINKKEEKVFVKSLEEYKKRTDNYIINPNELFDLIIRGFYPELYDNKELITSSFYEDYLQTYLEKDVSDFINLKDKTKFISFMEVLGSLTGEELVLDNLAKLLGISIKTISSWLSVLEAGNIIYFLEPYNELSLIKRAVERKKIYFIDTGLAAYLAGFNSAETLKRSRFSGQFVETYIINEIRKSYLNNNEKVKFYYYRDRDQKEIDLLILSDGKLNLIECKSGLTYSLRDVSGFKVLINKTKYEINLKCIICNTDYIYGIGENTIVLPITAI